MTADTIIPSPDNSQSFNRYAYVDSVGKLTNETNRYVYTGNYFSLIFLLFIDLIGIVLYSNLHYEDIFVETFGFRVFFSCLHRLCIG